MKYYSKSKARKYLINSDLHFEMTKELWKQLLDTGRIVPDKGRRFSKALLDKYIYEVKPR